MSLASSGRELNQEQTKKQLEESFFKMTEFSKKESKIMKDLKAYFLGDNAYESQFVRDSKLGYFCSSVSLIEVNSKAWKKENEREVYTDTLILPTGSPVGKLYKIVDDRDRVENAIFFRGDVNKEYTVFIKCYKIDDFK